MTLTVEPPPVEALDAGVINDASARRRRQRGVITLGVLLAVIIGVVAYRANAGGNPQRFPAAAPAVTSGSLRPWPRADFEFFITPDLVPAHTAGLTMTARYVGGASSCEGACSGYVGGATPIGMIIGGTGAGVLASVPHNVLPDYVLFVAPDVAAVRVGDLGTVGSRTSSGLPPGDKIVAFAVPQTAQSQSPLGPLGRGVALTALNSHGEVLQPPSPLPANLAAPTRSTERSGACAVAATVRGLVDIQPLALTMIKLLPASTPGLFLSCLDDKYALGASKFNVAILLNAHRPGTPPPALWGSTPVPGHPGTVEVAPPPDFPTNQDTTAPLHARRAGNAWLVVQARPGFSPNPTQAQRIHVLDSLRITRLNLTQR